MKVKDESLTLLKLRLLLLTVFLLVVFHSPCLGWQEVPMRNMGESSVN